MSEKRIALDLAAFLDSGEARGLDLAPPSLRKLARWFFSICYEDLGKEPRLLDGDDVGEALGRLLPARLGPADALAPRVPEVFEALFGHLERSAVVPHLFEMRQALEAGTEGFLETVRRGEHAHRHRERTRPVVHRAAKLGRNDPCSCGSGKKFKKCHGKGA